MALGCPFERFALSGTAVVVAGEKAADLRLRLSYAGVDQATITNPLDALARLPAGKVDVVANYTAFRAVLAWSAGKPQRERSRPVGSRDRRLVA